MLEAAWWLPSVVVFGAAAVGAVLVMVGVRRAASRRGQVELDAGRRLEIEAKGLIVRADESVREGRREVAFAEAQFGAARAAPLREAVDRAGGLLREALLLQQRLDDAEPDTAAERRTWSSRIADGCRSAIALVDAATAELTAARAAERDVADELPVLRERIAQLQRRLATADAALEHLGRRFASSTLAAADADRRRASAAVAEAGVAVEVAAQRAATAGAGDAAEEPAADLLGRARAAAEQAERRLEAVERLEADLATASDEARAEAARLDVELAEARAQRDGLADGSDAAEPGVAAAAVDLGAALRQASALLAEPAPALADPFLLRDRLRAARDRVEAARADARRASSRLHGARSALGGALAIAESRILVARGLVDRGRSHVGADARTRLAEAERQLVIARQEPDPVAALDAARRAAARASDAEALARYDGSHG
ncbi:hypothetical protein GE115_09905 [Agromyces sp. CFH 90414]|uniref:TPM domain-containing protein n=1 Tax=Agromyces agglutinans TaxID=2662258 RepID=A0A6I2FGZ3_9MICO|nr:hypothetical protein [Agromyces agglutinans]MRG60178.1 hypothetical protein [Agromyces agglutinans]